GRSARLEGRDSRRPLNGRRRSRQERAIEGLQGRPARHVHNAQRQGERGAARVLQELGASTRHDSDRLIKEQDIIDLIWLEFLKESLRTGGAFGVAASGFSSQRVAQEKKRCRRPMFL